jgi:hypothetical protein
MYLNSNTGRLRQEDCKFKASLGYTARLCLKNSNNNGREGEREGEEGKGGEGEEEKE